MMKKILPFALACGFLALTACNAASLPDSATTQYAEDTSASAAAASSVGGALAGTAIGGAITMNSSPSIWSLLLPNAYATANCPTILTANGSGCTNNGNDIDLTYSGCSFAGATAKWTGKLEVSRSDAAPVTCGTFPDMTTFANNASLQRQFVGSLGVASSGARVSSRGTSMTIDHHSNNLANFDGQAIAAMFNAGYGTQLILDGLGGRKSIKVRQRIAGTAFDHSVDGTVSVAESGNTRTVTGTMTVYHNKVQVVGTSTFTNVVYNNTCCMPISGTITTVFAVGANVTTPINGGASLVGHTETLTFQGCGSGTLQAAGSSTSASVLETQCF